MGACGPHIFSSSAAVLALLDLRLVHEVPHVFELHLARFAVPEHNCVPPCPTGDLSPCRTFAAGLPYSVRLRIRAVPSASSLLKEAWYQSLTYRAIVRVDCLIYPHTGLVL